MKGFSLGTMVIRAFTWVRNRPLLKFWFYWKGWSMGEIFFQDIGFIQPLNFKSWKSKIYFKRDQDLSGYYSWASFYCLFSVLWLLPINTGLSHNFLRITYQHYVLCQGFHLWNLGYSNIWRMNQHIKGMANHFSIALRTPWMVWKGKRIEHWKINSPGQ